MTYKAAITIKGYGPYTQSFQHNSPKLPKELPNAYEERTWRNKIHRNDDGFAIMPSMSFKNMMAAIAKRLSVQVPGKGKATYTKHFTAGVQPTGEESLILIPQPDGSYAPIKVDDVPKLTMSVPSDGVSGSGKRVTKFFPLFRKGWKTTVSCLITDDVIDYKTFLQHVQEAGMLCGIGSFRIENKGTFGGFMVEEFDWSVYTSEFKPPRIVVDGKVIQEVKAA